MPIPVDIVPKLDRRAIDDVASDVKRFFANTGREAGNDFDRNVSRGMSGSTGASSAAARRSGATVSGEFSKEFNKGITQGIHQATSQFGMMGRAAEGVFNNISSKGGTAALGVAGVGLAAVAVMKQFYDLGAAWDDVGDKIAARTGKVGEDMKGITESVKTVAKDTAAPLEDIGDVAGRVVQSLHLTGKPLEQMTKNISILNEKTGEKLGIRELGNAFRLFGVNVEKDGVKALDSLYDASASTGIPLNELITTLTTKGAVAAKQFGLSIGETAGLLTTFENAGLPLNESINGLAVALKSVPDQTALAGRITEIKRLVDIGDSDGANKLASKTFGRGFVDFLDAIGSGAIDAQSLNTALDGTGSTIDGLAKQTDDWQEKWQVLINSLKTELEPAASTVFSGISTMIDQYLIRPFSELNDLVGGIAGAWRNMFGPEAGGLPQAAAGIPSQGGYANAQRERLGLPPIEGAGLPVGRGGAGSYPNPQPGIGSSPYTPHMGSPGGGGRAFGAYGITDQDITRLGGNAGLPSPASMAAIARAQALNGLPYKPGTTDCSGYISQIYSAMTGTPTHFTTESFDAAALGFHKGFMPGALNVGIKHGGPGGGHMAGTLPNGVNVESGGRSGGVTYGSGTGAQSGQFTEQWWYMPGYQIGGAVNNYNPDHPTGGGNFNPDMQIDTSRAGFGSPSPWKIHANQMLQGFETMHMFSPLLPDLNQWISNKIGRFNKGGSTDTVHAMLTPGEHVLTVDDVAALGGQPGVYALRNALHRNGGGPIPPWITPGQAGERHAYEPGGNFNPAAQLDISTTKWSGSPGWYGMMDQLLPSTHIPGLLVNANDYMTGFEPGDARSAQWLTMIMGQNRGWMKSLDVKQKPPIPFQDWFIASSAQSRKGFQDGGGVFDPTQSFLEGMQQGGGYGGMIASFIQMGMNQGKGRQGIGNGPPPISSGQGTGPPPGPPPVQGFSPASVGGTGMQGLGAVDLAGGLASAMPGLGPAAAIGAKEANRAIGFGGQALAIGIQAIPETFLLHGSALGDPSRNWLGKIASGIGGGRPAPENVAGQSGNPAMPMQQQPQQQPVGAGSAAGSAIGQVNFHGVGNSVQDQQSMIRDIDRQVRSHGAGTGW